MSNTVVSCSYATPNYAIFAVMLFWIGSKRTGAKLFSIFHPQLRYFLSPQLRCFLSPQLRYSLCNVLNKNANSRTALWRTVSGTKMRLLRNTNSSIWNPLNCKLSVLFPIDQSFPEGKFGRWKCKLGRIGPSSKRKRLGSVHKWRLLYRVGGVKKWKSAMDIELVIMWKWH